MRCTYENATKMKLPLLLQCNLYWTISGCGSSKDSAHWQNEEFGYFDNRIGNLTFMATIIEIKRENAAGGK